MPTQSIKRAMLMQFYPASYTADVLILEAGNAYLQGIPIATHFDWTSAQPGGLCAVLFFDQQNQSDALVLAVYPNASQGLPSPQPGRITFVTPTQQLNSFTIASGTTQVLGITGGNIPSTALAVLLSAYFTCPSTASYIQISPHGGAAGQYMTIGNLAVAGGFLNASGIVPLSSGEIDIKALGGACTVTLYTYGYIQ